MSDLAVFILVLCAFYVHDCSLWIERDTAVFLMRWAGRWRPVFPHPLLSGARKGLLLSFRLPPLVPVYLAYPWRLILSPSHIAPAVRSEEPTEASAAPTISWSTIRTVDAADGMISINGRPAIACQTQERAKATADLLRNLAQRSPAHRAEGITDALSRSVDVTRLREDLATLTSAEHPLRILCNALFVHLFLVAPGLMCVVSLARLWPALVAILGVLVLAIAFAYRGVHRRLWPTDRSERRSVLIHCCLYPPAAIRTYDTLAHRLCAPYHPATVAVALCDARVRDGFLRRVLRDLRFAAVRNTENGMQDEPDTWFRAALEAHIHRMLEGQGLRPEAYLDAPPQTDRNSLSYCPRCETEYAVPAGSCRDCAGVPLVSFVPADGAATAPSRGARMTV